MVLTLWEATCVCNDLLGVKDDGQDVLQISDNGRMGREEVSGQNTES